MRTNIIKLDLSESAYSKRFRIFHVVKHGDYLRYNDWLFDRIRTNIDIVRAVKFSHQDGAWILTESGNASDELSIRDALNGCIEKGSAGIHFEEVPVASVPNNVVMELLFSSISEPLGEMGDISNVSGQLYVVQREHCGSWTGRMTAVHGNNPRWIRALHISVNRDMAVELKVSSFTSCAAHRYDTRLPRYKLVDGRHLRRVSEPYDPNDAELYVNRAPSNDRYSKFHFLDAGSLDSYRSTKIGILDAMLRIVQEEYGDVARVSFREIPESLWHGAGISNRKSRACTISDIDARLDGYTISVFDQTQENAELAREIVEKIQKSFRLPRVKVSNELRADCVNLAIIHEKDYYDQDKNDDTFTCLVDPHEDRTDIVVQHFTVETEPTVSTVVTAIKELAIKCDLLEGQVKMTLCDNLDAGWTFCLKTTIQTKTELRPPDTATKPEGKRKIKKDVFSFYSFLCIDKTGQITFDGPYENAPLSEDDFSYLMTCMKQEENVEYGYIDDEGNINLVSNSNLFGMPAYETISNDLMHVPAKMRNNKAAISRSFRDGSVEKYFRDIVGLDCAIDKAGKNGIGYYRVGLRGSGMKFENTHKASVIRMVKAEKYSELSIEKLIPLLDVSFVRIGEMTVVPFPIKYLREWVRFQHLEDRVLEQLSSWYPNGFVLKKMTIA